MDAGGVFGITPPKNLEISSDRKANWKQWCQQFDWYAETIQLDKKPQGIQIATFMSVIGPAAIEIFNNFNLSSNQKKDLQVIKTKFQDYFEPKLNVTYERFIFFKIVQDENEQFDNFLTRIRKHANGCTFGTHTDEMLKDKIVFGVRSSQLRKRLLTEEFLTLDKAVSICQTNEQASKHLEAMENKTAKATAAVSGLKIKAREYRESEFDCTRCGERHKPRACPAYEQKCTKCNKLGHFAKQCHSNILQLRRKKGIINTSESETDSESGEYTVVE